MSGGTRVTFQIFSLKIPRDLKAKKTNFSKTKTMTFFGSGGGVNQQYCTFHFNLFDSYFRSCCKHW